MPDYIVRNTELVGKKAYGVRTQVVLKNLVTLKKKGT